MTTLTPTVRTGRAIDPIPGLPQVYRFKAYGAEGFDYGFTDDGGFVDAPYVIRVVPIAPRMLELPGNFTREFNGSIRATGAVECPYHSSPKTFWFNVDICHRQRIITFAQRWNARFDQQAFDMLCRAARGPAERGQEAA